MEDQILNKKINSISFSADQRFDITLSSIGDAVISTDNSGKISFMNPVAENLTGWKISEALHKPSAEVFRIINEETRQTVESPIEKVFRTGTVAGLANHTLLIRKDGTEIPIDDSGAPIRDSQGNVIGVVLVFRDISERKEAEKLLLESEARLKRSQEIAHLGSWELDLRTNKLSWSDEIYRIFGLKPQEFEATYEAFLERVHPQDRSSVDNAYLGSLREGRDIYEIEHRIIRKSSGEIRYVHEKCYHLRDESNNIIISLGMVHDITDRKITELALKESEERVRKKLEAILSPDDTNIDDLELIDILNCEEIQSMMEYLYELTSIPMAIIDFKGNVLVGVGWQQICTRFHRVHPVTCKNCIESDIQLTIGIPEGEFKLYKCANGMWDIATPLIIGGQHKGNLFMGQFFFDDEVIDYEQFKNRAILHGFNKEEYIKSLDNALRISRKKLESAKGFYLKFANKISKLSYSNIQLAKSISQRDKIHEDLLRNNLRQNILSETAGKLLASPDPQKIVDELCDKVRSFLDCEIFVNYILDESKGKLHLNASGGLSAKTIKNIEWLNPGVAVCGCVAQSGQRIIAENIQQSDDPKTGIVRSLGIRAYCCHPLSGQNGVLGTLSFGTANRDSFSDDDVAMMKMVADLVSIAMDRLRNEVKLLESQKNAKERAEELEKMMNIVPSALWIAQDPQCKHILGNATANNFYEAKVGENVSAGADPGEPVQLRRFFRNGKELSPDELTMQEAAATGKDVLNSELDVLLPSGKWMTMLGNASPLKDENGNVRGCIGAFMDITERKKAERELLKLNRVLNALGKSNHAMIHAQNEMDYINEVCKILVEDCGHSLVWIGFAQDDENKTVLPVGHYGFLQGYLEKLTISWGDNEFGNGPTGRCIKTGKPVLCNDTLSDPSFKPWRSEALKYGFYSSIALPLISGEKPLGAIAIYSRENNAFSPDEIILLSNLADDLSYGIHTLRLKESEKRALALMTESEQRYRTLFNEMVEGFTYHQLLLDENEEAIDYTFIMVNPAFEKQTGLKTEEVIGKKASEVFSSFKPYWIDKYRDVALNGISANFEVYNAALDRFFKVNAFSSRKGYFSTIFEDITERVIAQKELQSTKNYLESLINNANAPIIVWNPKLEIQLFNRAFEHLTGYKSEEVIGRKLEILFPSVTMQETKQKIEKVRYENWNSIEIPILTKRNEIRTVLWNSANIYDADSKSLISVIAQGNDITERKLAEEKLNLALDNGNIGTWEKDLTTNHLIWDKRMEKMFGFEEGAFDGRHETFENCLVEEDVPITREAIKKALKEDIPYETVYRIKSADGQVNHIHAKALVVKDKNGKPVKMTGVCFDVTDMKKGAEGVLIRLNEELHRSNKELEQFAYVASHDLQEPLRMVSSFTQLLAMRYKEKIDEDGKEFINYAVEGAKRMQRLINDLLNYSRVGTRGQNFTFIDFNDIIRKTLNNLKMSIEEKHAEIVCDELPSIKADEMQIIQLFQNLIANSLKFCALIPKIRISCKEQQAHFLFTVKDNGIGIEEQYFDKIFLIFQRLQPRDQFSGTGIGLAICKRIVERHGGRIWINSEPGKGTTFYFTIMKNI